MKRRKLNRITFLLILSINMLASQNYSTIDSLKNKIFKEKVLNMQISALYFMPFSLKKTHTLNNDSAEYFGQFFNENITIGDITTFSILPTIGYSAKLSFQKSTKYNYSICFGLGFLYSQSTINYNSILHRPPNPYNRFGIHFEGYGKSQQEEYSITFNLGLNTNLYKKLWFTTNFNLNTTIFINTTVDEYNTLDGSHNYCKSRKVNRIIDFFYLQSNGNGLMKYSVNSEHVLFYELINRKTFIGVGLNYFFNSKYQSYLTSQISFIYKLWQH